VAVVGFSAFERDALQVFFRLAANREPHYVAAPGLAACEFAIVDADAPQAVREVLEAGRLGAAVFVGAAAPPPGALGRLPRPIDPLHVMRQLDLAVARLAAERAPAEVPVLAPAAKAGAHHAHRPSARARQASRADVVRDFRNSEGFSNSVLAAGDLVLDPVLVVDDSPIARRFLESRLQRLGYPVDGADSGEQALEMAAARPYRFVFLDVNLGGIDGFETCRRLKERPLPRGERQAVVFVTGRTAATDRVRGTLAGGDAYLAKPLVEDELRRVLAQFDDAFERVFEDTSSQPTLDI
jgi:CheY-like chemotaxis protein